MRVEQYLHTSFDGADCEYLEGEKYNMAGSMRGSRICCSWLPMKHGLSIRIRANERRYRVADLAAWRRSDELEEIPTIPPFLAIEILSPDDRPVAMMAKVRDYLSMGAERIRRVSKSKYCEPKTPQLFGSL